MGNHFDTIEIPLLIGQKLTEALELKFKVKGIADRMKTGFYSIDEVTVSAIKDGAANLKVEYQYGE